MPLFAMVRRLRTLQLAYAGTRVCINFRYELQRRLTQIDDCGNGLGTDWRWNAVKDMSSFCRPRLACETAAISLLRSITFMWTCSNVVASFGKSRGSVVGNMRF